MPITDILSGDGAIGCPIAYATNFPGQSLMMRIVYRAFNGHIYEIHNVAATLNWGDSTDLTVDLSAGDGHIYKI